MLAQDSQPLKKQKRSSSIEITDVFQLKNYLNEASKLDNEISIKYETTSTEEWKIIAGSDILTLNINDKENINNINDKENINNINDKENINYKENININNINKESITEEQIEYKQKIQRFVKIFRALRRNLKKIPIKKMLEYFDFYVVKNDTKMLQFLLFERAKKNHKKIFAFFYSQILKSRTSKSYISFYISLLVRLDIPRRDKILYLNYYVKYMKKNMGSYNSMFFVYSMCFLKAEEFKENSVEVFLKNRKEILPAVAENFKEIYKLDGKNCEVFDDKAMFCDVVNLFPFDRPILEEIFVIIRKNFVEFEK